MYHIPIYAATSGLSDGFNNSGAELTTILLYTIILVGVLFGLYLVLKVIDQIFIAE